MSPNADPRRSVRFLRPVSAAVVAATLAALLGMAPGVAVSSSLAAGAGPVLVGTSQYDVQPASHRVRVTVDLAIANQTQDTVTTTFVYDRANVTVLPGVTGIVASIGGAKIKASIASRSASATILSLPFPKPLASGQGTAVHLVFDLPDKGGAPTRDIRIGDALASFPVWAFGSPGVPGSSVTVRFPAGYHVIVASGRLSGPSIAANGTLILTSGRLADPFALNAWVVGDRAGAFAETPLDVPTGAGSARVLVRAWKDDAAWGRRVTTTLARQLPALARAIGASSPWSGPVAIEEVTTRSIGGLAATLDRTTMTIRLAYTADQGVLLAALAQLWFDDTHYADRWIGEGLAGWAATQAAAQLKVSLPRAPAGAAPVDPFPLNAWASGDGDAVDAWGRATATEVFRLIAARVGPQGIKDVVTAVTDGSAAYQPVPPGGGDASAGSGSPGTGSAGNGSMAVEGATARVDWRILLDLVAERTGADLTDLWQRFVVRPTDLGLLDVRAKARVDRAAMLVAAGSWPEPSTIRAALRSWQFADAESQMSAVRDVFAARDELAVAAAIAGLQVPTTLRTAYEKDAPATALAEAGVERAIVDQVAVASRTGAASGGLLQRIGLVGVDPAGLLAESRRAFATGDFQRAQSTATAARDAWAGAADLGGLRVRLLLALLIVVAVVLLLFVTRPQHRQRPSGAN